MGVTSMATLRKPFPEHWGSPPLIQTKDLRNLPDGYGRGSSTLSGWIKNNMDADARGRPAATPKSAARNAADRAAEEAAAQAEAARQARAAAAREADRQAAEEKLMSGGKGDYMDYTAEWYRKWQYRKDYSDNRDKRYVRNYHMLKDPATRRMQMQMMHGH